MDHRGLSSWGDSLAYAFTGFARGNMRLRASRTSEAFTGSSYLFSMLRSSDLSEERKCHDRAVEQLQAAQAEWSRNQTERLDWISEDLRRQGHAVQTFRVVDDAMRGYSRVTGKKLDPLGPEPKLSDFYVSSSGQRDREISFVVLGMAATGLVAYNLTK